MIFILLSIVSLSFSAVHAASGTWTVYDMRAQGLRDLDTFLTGESDPFAIITIDGTTQTTGTKDETLNPSWSQIFSFSNKPWVRIPMFSAHCLMLK